MSNYFIACYSFYTEADAGRWYKINKEHLTLLPPAFNTISKYWDVDEVTS